MLALDKLTPVFAAYLFDVDGTLLYPDRVVPGAVRALIDLKARGRRVLAVTNNSSLGRRQLGRRLRQFGLPLEDNEVLSALTATVELVAREKPHATAYVFGNEGLRSEVERSGLLVIDDDPNVDYVIVGNCHAVTYGQVTRAMRALLAGARFVAVNADRHYVGADGGIVPGAGFFVAGLERASGRAPDVVVGKPSITLLLEAAATVGVDPARCVYVGDNLEADVAGAHDAGMAACLVLTGISSAQQVRAARGAQVPEVVVWELSELLLSAEWTDSAACPTPAR